MIVIVDHFWFFYCLPWGVGTAEESSMDLRGEQLILIFLRWMLCCADWEARHLVDHQVTNKGRDDAQNVGPSWNLSVAYFTYAWRRRNTRFKDLKLSRNMSKFVAQSIPALYFLEQLFSTRNKCFCCVTSWSRKVKNTKYRPKTYGDTLLHEKLRVFVSRIS